MRKKFVLVALAATMLAACHGETGTLPIYVSTATTTPPLNTIVFGPCGDEFSMPDSRRGNCDLYYALRRKESPWAQREAAVRAAAYQPGELRCWRTLGGKAECEAVGPLRTPPALVSPNNMKSE